MSNLPVTGSAPAPASPAPAPEKGGGLEFLTEAELRLRERENLIAVLERARWKIKGPDGAAELLGVKPTTLLSRIKKMGLRRPS